MSKGPESHTTTRRLTKPWEFGARRLYVYNFPTDTLSDKSSRHLLVARKSFGYDVEKFLNDLVENPLASYLDNINAGQLVSNLPWKQERALLLSLFFQTVRVRAGRGDPTATQELHDLLTKDDSHFDQIAMGFRQDFRCYGCKLPNNMELYFPGNGITGVPVVSADPKFPAILFQPTGLDTFHAAVPVSIPQHIGERQLREAIATKLVVAYSVGLTCDDVILPPKFFGEDTSTVRSVIRDLRTSAKGIADIISTVNKNIFY